MKLYKAQVADILRASQRDNLFIMDLEQQLSTFLKSTGSQTYHKFNPSVPLIANIWYYIMTSLAKIQTLGEEYMKTIRLDRKNKIPSKSLGIFWLILHVGGETMIDRFLNYSKRKIMDSPNLRNEAKSVLLRSIEIFKEEKVTLKRIHLSLFYINGRYQNISNRITGIQYVLLRDWLKDDTFSGSFYLLGNLSLFYVLLSFVFKSFLSSSSSKDLLIKVNSQVSKKGCILCGENIKSACSTPCGHIFCWDCIYESLNYQKTCPVCREELVPSRIIFLQNFV